MGKKGFGKSQSKQLSIALIKDDENKSDWQKSQISRMEKEDGIAGLYPGIITCNDASEKIIIHFRTEIRDRVRYVLANFYFPPESDFPELSEEEYASLSRKICKRTLRESTEIVLKK